MICQLLRKYDCGFQNFNAEHGCSKCLKKFSTAIGLVRSQTIYGGYDCHCWPDRDNSVHIMKATDSRNARTKKERKEIECSYGVKYSELIKLPAFDIIRYHVIDPMHNMFLGIAKHTTKVWRDLNIIRENECRILQEKVDSLNPPSKLGRIPRKI